MSTAFAELGLNEHILAGVDSLGFTTPTPVQAEAIPAILAGRDVVASAQTGTGKTAAFTLPVLQNILDASRTARKELLNQVPTEAEASGSDVLADSVPQDSLSIPSPPEGGDASSDRKPRRRRRRHHKKPSDVHATLSMPAAKDVPKKARASAEKPAGASSKKPAADDELKPRRKRRRKRKKSSVSPNAEVAQITNAHSFGPFALVITPTRELAQQIDGVASVVCEHTGQRAVIVMGGARLDRQICALKDGCDMLVATPGRLIDLMDHGHVDLTHVQVLVLDEADRMLDMGFWPSVRRIVAALPTQRQNLLFSATIPPSITSSIETMLHDPVYVEIARVGETADTVEEHLCPVTQGQKSALLQGLIRMHEQVDSSDTKRILVFCRTKQRVEDVFGTLKKAGFKVDVMHADRPQKARERALSKFRAGTCCVLVATDVMSRGIDVNGIDAVVNYDVPLDPEDYVHRIGRTGRAGATGHAYTFVAPDEITPLREIEYFTGKLIPTWDLPEFPYDDGRIVPNPSRSATKPKYTMFSGLKARGRGMSGGRYGRHY